MSSIKTKNTLNPSQRRSWTRRTFRYCKPHHHPGLHRVRRTPININNTSPHPLNPSQRHSVRRTFRYCKPHHHPGSSSCTWNPHQQHNSTSPHPLNPSQHRSVRRTFRYCKAPPPPGSPSCTWNPHQHNSTSPHPLNPSQHRSVRRIFRYCKAPPPPESPSPFPSLTEDSSDCSEDTGTFRQQGDLCGVQNNEWSR